MATKLKRTLTLALMILMNPACRALDTKCSLRVANIYSSDMVLQRTVNGRGAYLWGYADYVGATVAVTVDGHSVDTKTYKRNSDIVWTTVVKKNEGGPYQIDISSGKCKISLQNVLFGDVWLCSGQSNMEHRMEDSEKYEDDPNQIKNYQSVRVLHVGHKVANARLDELAQKEVMWKTPKIAIVKKFSAVCWLFGTQLWKLYKRPIGLVLSAVGGTPIEAWSSRDPLNKCFGTPNGRPNILKQNIHAFHRPRHLYNGMIHPFHRMSIFGILWYQGETNAIIAPFVHTSKEYECALSTMISDWRNKWDDATSNNNDPLFPFGVVQLAPHKKNDKNKKGFPNIRWAQSGLHGNTPTKRLPNVFMAVAIDLPDFKAPNGRRHGIHPIYKRQIADRLVLGARALAYGEDVIFQGPVPTIFEIEEQEARLLMDYDCQYTLLEKRGENDIFETCCSTKINSSCIDGVDHKWVISNVINVNKSRVFLKTNCPKDEHVVGVRYAWFESPCFGIEKCPIYGHNLPAPPFLKIGLHSINKDSEGMTGDCGQTTPTYTFTTDEPTILSSEERVTFWNLSLLGKSDRSAGSFPDQLGNEKKLNFCWLICQIMFGKYWYLF